MCFVFSLIMIINDIISNYTYNIDSIPILEQENKLILKEMKENIDVTVTKIAT